MMSSSRVAAPPASEVLGATATERLAAFTCRLRFEDLPKEVVERTKELLVHHIGVGLRGHADRSAEQARDAVHLLNEGLGTSTIIGSLRRASLADAVFANAYLMSHAGLDDFQVPPGVHAGVQTHPAGLTIGERVQATGRDYITAVVAGYEVMTKLAYTLFPWKLARPRRPFTLYGSFGAATVAARLLGLSEEQTAHAYGHAVHAGLGVVEGAWLTRPVQPLVASGGVMAAVLAWSGLPQVRTMIEGEQGLFRSYADEVPAALETALLSLGEDFEIMKANTKLYPGTGLNIVPQELTLGLVREHRITPADAQRIDVTIAKAREKRERVYEQEARPDHPGWQPVNATGSLRFLVASVVALGRIDPFALVERRDDAFEVLLDRVHLHFDGVGPIRHCRVEITTAGGPLTAEADDHVFPPVAAQEWFAGSGADFLSDEQISELADLTERLEDVDDVGKITRRLAPAT